MKKLNVLTIVSLIIMMVLSLTNLIGLDIAKFTIFIGIIIFFVNKIITKQPFAGSGLDFSTLKTDLKSKSIWLWIALPLVLNIIQVVIAKYVLPEYITYELTRVEDYISKDNYFILIFQFLVLALGEEIAWRAFFQQQATKVAPVILVILGSSLLFALGHYTKDNILIVGYNMIFIFIVSCVFCIIYHKTKNAWVSTIAHFLGNAVTFFVMVLFLV